MYKIIFVLVMIGLTVWACLSLLNDGMDSVRKANEENQRAFNSIR